LHEETIQRWQVVACNSIVGVLVINNKGRIEDMVAKERKFNGKRFMLYDDGFAIMKAKQKANELKNKGYRVRTVPTDKGYAIYRRQK